MLRSSFKGKRAPSAFERSEIGKPPPNTAPRIGPGEPCPVRSAEASPFRALELFAGGPGREIAGHPHLSEAN
jgi:hypothetical protein